VIIGQSLRLCLSPWVGSNQVYAKT
jgi:hypothetical protein